MALPTRSCCTPLFHGNQQVVQLLAPSDLCGGDLVPALSLWEPWASLMAVGAKTIETRSWATRYRGPLLICASKNRSEATLADDSDFGRALGSTQLAFGHAVALVRLYDCEATIWTGAPSGERMFGDYSAGRFAWCTDQRRRLRPFPVRGSQGLFTVRLPDDLEDYE